MSLLAQFAAELPHIQIVSRDDKEFSARRKIYNSAVDTQPLAIALPQNAQDVASIVEFANKTNAPISVRSGGHDLFGRSLVQDAIVVDMRAMKSIVVDKTASTAVIGGGVCAEELSRALSDHGCTTPCPNIATVGYIGYATMGGYGPMAHRFGLGVDHLLKARIVDAEGNIVEADEDVMKGIRGAGGNFGIVVEATIKIYPFVRVLAGSIIFESSDYRVSMANIQNGLEAMTKANDYPPELDVQPVYAHGPTGAYYGVLFMWAGPDIEERGRHYHSKVLSFHPARVNQVKPMSMAEAIELWAPLVPDSSFMNSRAVSVRSLTPKVYDILVKACSTMPDDFATMLTWHEVRPCSPSFDPSKSLPSVFNAREAHYVIEILSNAVDEKNFAAVSAWGLALRDELLRETPKEELLPAQWLASTKNEELGSLEGLYGEENAKFLRQLKAKKDPKRIFRHAVPNFDVLQKPASNGNHA